MSPNHRAADDDVVRSLLGVRPAPGECPDPVLLVAWAEARLEDERRERVEAHLAACEPCRELALLQRTETGVGDEVPAATRRPATILPFRRRPLVAALLAVAAVVVVGVGVVRLLGRDEPGTPGPARDRLMAAAGEAARAHAELLGGFTPLSADELAGGAPPALRGGLSIVRPADHVLRPPTRLAWTAVPGATTYHVTVLAPDGTVRWTIDTPETSLDWPSDRDALVPGTRGVLEVTCDAVLGRAEGRRAFVVADAAAARAFEDAARRLGERAPDLAALLRAHLALRRGFVEEAEAAAEAHLAGAPTDADARRLLDHARRRLGVLPAGTTPPR